MMCQMMRVDIRVALRCSLLEIMQRFDALNAAENFGFGGAHVGHRSGAGAQSPVGPAATAFWRLAIAMPFALWTGRFALAMAARDIALALVSGFLLAGDLVLWNNAILRTSVMEATVLVMTFPLIVAVGEIWIFGRRLSAKLILGGLYGSRRHGGHCQRQGAGHP